MVVTKLTYLNFFVMAYMIALIIIYFSKERFKNEETLIYKIMLFCNLFGLILQLASGIVGYNYYSLSAVVADTIIKWYLIYFIAFGVLVLWYVINLCTKNNYKLMIKIFAIYLALSMMIFMLPMQLHLDYENQIVYSYGKAVDYSSILGLGTSALILIIMIPNIKKFDRKKIIPMFLYLIFCFIAIIIQKYNPEIMIICFIESFLCFIMYFTIENPDMKLIEELNIAKDQADRANNAKTEFLSSMSHEIRTPLNAIVGFSNTLNENPKLPEELKDEVKDILNASDNLLEIVNGVLDISKIEANKIEIVKSEYDTKKMFDELAKLTKSRIGTKPIEFEVKIDKSIPRVLYGDNIRVKQVILNLLTNAAKYTDEGKITFGVNSVKKDNIVRLIVSVEDTGRGIKTENINKLFNKFERLDEERNTTIEGTGLGLAITKKLVELMHGNIVVQSKFGKGSKFTVSIDQGYVEKPNIKLDETSVVMNKLDLHDKKILVVDDNKLNLKVACKLLEMYKPNITSLESGIETLELLKKDKSFDIILLDDMMPKLSGIETLNKIKEEKLYDGPIVVLTANALTGEKEKYIEKGFDDYLAKPIEKLELYRVLKKYLNK